MKNRKGFTLIELVLTIAILTLSVGVTTDIILSITRSYTKTQVTNEIEQNANFVLLKMEKELRNAQSVTTPNSTTTVSNSLAFIDKNSIPVTYSVSGGKVSRCFGVGCTSQDITNTNTTSGVSVTCPASPGGCFTFTNGSPTVIRLNVTFSQPGSPSKAFTGTVNLNNTIVVRGTY